MRDAMSCLMMESMGVWVHSENYLRVSLICSAKSPLAEGLILVLLPLASVKINSGTNAPLY